MSHPRDTEPYLDHSHQGTVGELGTRGKKSLISQLASLDTLRHLLGILHLGSNWVNAHHDILIAEAEKTRSEAQLNLARADTLQGQEADRKASNSSKSTELALINLALDAPEPGKALLKLLKSDELSPEAKRVLVVLLSALVAYREAGGQIIVGEVEPRKLVRRNSRMPGERIRLKRKPQDTD
jgi:hypothetical protein